MFEKKMLLELHMNLKMMTKTKTPNQEGISLSLLVCKHIFEVMYDITIN